MQALNTLMFDRWQKRGGERNVMAYGTPIAWYPQYYYYPSYYYSAYYDYYHNTPYFLPHYDYREFDRHQLTPHFDYHR